jgi:hypothetical protein
MMHGTTNIKFDLHDCVQINILKLFYAYEIHFRISTYFMGTYVCHEFYVNSLFVI